MELVSATTTATTASMQALDAISRDVHVIAQSGGSLLAWAPAIVALLTFCAAAGSTVAAYRSAKTASAAVRTQGYGIRQSQLETLRARFEEANYFLRFWQLNMATSESLVNEFLQVKHALVDLDGKARPFEHGEIKYRILQYSSISPESLYVEPRFARALEDPRLEHVLDLGVANHIIDHAAQDLIRDVLGPPWSRDRADLLRIYYFSRSINSWLKAAQPLEDAETRIQELTFVFGSELVLTLSSHRLFASRLFFGDLKEDSFEHYRDYYGLRDDEYARLVDQLATEADAQGMLTRENRLGIASTERLFHKTPSGRPMRKFPFPHESWVEASS